VKIEHELIKKTVNLISGSRISVMSSIEFEWTIGESSHSQVIKSPVPEGQWEHCDWQNIQCPARLYNKCTHRTQGRDLYWRLMNGETHEERVKTAKKLIPHVAQPCSLEKKVGRIIADSILSEEEKAIV
jgi:hypothetical protein